MQLKEVIVQKFGLKCIDGLLAFKHTLRLLRDESWGLAAMEMLDSKWAREDSPERAKRLADRNHKLQSL